ncbi:MAG: MFS transporter [Anaerolineae bacterium]|nr:MFS transporter [Anaerolineae bacterium]
MNKASIGYWQLLRQNRRFRYLWGAQLISAAGDWFNSVAVLGLVLQLTDSGLGASLVILCNTLPSFFLIPFAGPVVDRFDRRTLMIVTNVVSAGFALLFMLVHDVQSLWLLYLATVLLVIAASFFGPASSASIPNIVSDEELFAANALSGATWGVMVMVGSALGGLVSAAFGRDVAFVVNAVSFIIAALLLATIDVPSPQSDRAMAPWQDFKEGLVYLRGHLPALGLVGVKLGWGLGAGAVVLLSVFGQQVFRAGDAGIGFLYSARGLGALLGPIIVQAVIGRNIDRLRQAIWAGFLVAAIGYALLSASGWLNSLLLGCVALLIGHIGGGTIWAISSMILQLTVPDRFRGRVFAVDYGLATLTTGSSTLMYGVALQAQTSPMSLALVAAGLFTVYGMIWGVGTRQGPLHISEATLETQRQYP